MDVSYLVYPKSLSSATDWHAIAMLNLVGFNSSQLNTANASFLFASDRNYCTLVRGATTAKDMSAIFLLQKKTLLFTANTPHSQNPLQILSTLFPFSFQLKMLKPRKQHLNSSDIITPQLIQVVNPPTYLLVSFTKII